MRAQAPPVPGYWLANDGNWYPAPTPGYWLASDGRWYPMPRWPVPVLVDRRSVPVNRMAWVALVSGIVTIVLVMVPGQARAAMGHPLWLASSLLGLAADITGTVAGSMALSQIRRTLERGRTRALLGLIVCSVFLAVDVVILTIVLLLVLLTGGA